MDKRPVLDSIFRKDSLPPLTLILCERIGGQNCEASTLHFRPSFGGGYLRRSGASSVARFPAGVLGPVRATR